jgi:hypothetical protein
VASIPKVRTGPNSIARVLDHLRTAEVPAVVNQAYLTKHGFTGKDDIALIELLHAIDFISASGKPTSRWRGYRTAKNPRAALASAVKAAYAPVFETHQHAHRCEQPEVRAVLKQQPGLENPDVMRAASNFSKLCALADFAESGSGLSAVPAQSVGSSASTPSIPARMEPLFGRARAERLRRAFRCIDKELYLEAHINAWTAFMDLAHEAVDRAGTARLKALGPGWKGDTSLEIAKFAGDSRVIDALFALGLCTSDRRGALAEALRRRNECAHVSDFGPDRTSTLVYVAELLVIMATLDEATP